MKDTARLKSNGTWHVENYCEPAFGMACGPADLPAHKPNVCAGQPHCIVHNPSDHHMRDWPITFRGDKYLSERVCPHGIGHPDPDDLAWRTPEQREALSIHGCDGCCHTPHQTPIT
jgi:hypothetical protein